MGINIAVVGKVLFIGGHFGQWPTMAAILDFSGGQRPFEN
jgi:hypothetical protein